MTSFILALLQFCSTCSKSSISSISLLDSWIGADVEVLLSPWWTQWTLQDLNIGILWFGHGCLRFTLRTETKKLINYDTLHWITPTAFSLQKPSPTSQPLSSFLSQRQILPRGRWLRSTPEVPSERTCDIEYGITQNRNAKSTEPRNPSGKFSILTCLEPTERKTNIQKNLLSKIDNHPLESGNFSSTSWKILPSVS